MTGAAAEPMTPRQIGAALFSVFNPDFIAPLSQRQRPIAQACYVMSKAMQRHSQESYKAQQILEAANITPAVRLPRLQAVTTPADTDGHISSGLQRFKRQFDSDTAPARQGAAVGTGAAIPPPVFRISSQRKCARGKMTSAQ